MTGKIEEIDERIESNQRVFMLMIGYGKTNLFRDLNKRLETLVRKKNLLNKEKDITTKKESE